MLNSTGRTVPITRLSNASARCDNAANVGVDD